MSKRFVDTEMFSDDWFMDLSKDGKIMWFYLITTCDHAGIFKLNEKLCKFHTGVNDPASVIEQLGNRIVRVREQLYFIPKFITFQYPNFPNSKVMQQQSAVAILEKYGLFLNGSVTVAEDLPKSYGSGNDNKGVEGEKKTYIYNAFYDRQIEVSESNPNYIQVVKILFGENTMKAPLKSVLSMRDQLTFDQFQSLYAYKQKHGVVFSDILEDMENWDGLKKRKSVSLTFLTFMKHRYPDTNNK